MLFLVYLHNFTPSVLAVVLISYHTEFIPSSLLIPYFRDSFTFEPNSTTTFCVILSIHFQYLNEFAVNSAGFNVPVALRIFQNRAIRTELAHLCKVKFRGKHAMTNSITHFRSSTNRFFNPLVFVKIRLVDHVKSGKI